MITVLGTSVAKSPDGCAQVPASESHSRAVQSTEGYPVASSKKGLQVELVDDALALGIKHAAINVNLAQVIVPQPTANSISWSNGERTFTFQRDYLQRLDKNIKQLSDAGVLVNVILLVYESNKAAVNQILLHPNYDEQAPNNLSAFNVETEEGRAWFAATTQFLAERWSRPDQRFGRVAGYIIGNEVNSHWFWSICGRTTMEQFAKGYHQAVRMAHESVRTHSGWARVYISLEHHWNIRYGGGDEFQAFPGKDFLNYFAALVRSRGEFDWNLAYHPYPENLFEPRFWLDKSATQSPDTDRITFKNLEVLPEYLQRPELLYKGRPRRIILSEQGFHTPPGTEGEALQAAAFCLAYKKVESLAGIDALILHRHVDHPHEGGLLLGLRRYQPGKPVVRPKKKIYECFRLADTPAWEEGFEFALPLIGRENWNVRK